MGFFFTLAHRGLHFATCKLSGGAGGREGGGGGRLKEEEEEEGKRREGCREAPPMLPAQSGEGEQRSSVAVRASPGFHVRGHTACELLAGRRMMTMNGKQHFSMHPALHEPKYPGLHSGSEGMRRVCLPAPQVRSGRGRMAVECTGWRGGEQLSHWKCL